MRRWAGIFAVLLVAALVAWTALRSSDRGGGGGSGPANGGADARSGTPTAPAVGTAERAAPHGARAAAPRAAPEPVAPAGCVLVLDADGRPAWSASVWTADRDSPAAKWEWMGGVEGGAPLVAAAFRRKPSAFARAEARGAVSPAVPWDARGVVLRLGEGCVVEGRVVDGAGAGVPGAFVQVTGNRTRDDFTDDEGRFRVAGLTAAGEWTVEARGGGRSKTGTTVTFAAGETRKEVLLTLADLPPTALLVDVRFASAPRGTPWLALDAADAPEEGAQRRRRASATIDLPSRARTLVRFPPPAKLVAKPVRLTVRALGFRTTTAEATFPEGGVRAVRIDVPEGGVAPIGRVVDAAGSPAPGAEVHSVDTRGKLLRWASTTSGADGTFVVPVTEPWVVAILPGKDASDWVRMADVEGELVIRLGRGGAAEGVVRDAETKAPAEGATVVCAAGALPDDVVERRAVTDAAGRWRIAGVPAGCDVCAWVEDGGPWRPATAADTRPHGFESGIDLRAAGRAGRVASAGETWTRDLVAQHAAGIDATIAVRVPAGAAVPAQVTVATRWTYDAGWASSEGPVDLAQDATFTRYLRAGHHEVRVRAEGFAETLVETDVEGDGPARTLVVDLRPDVRGRVLARVLAPDGTPVREEGVVVSAWLEDGSRGTGTPDLRTDADGVADLTASLSAHTVTDTTVLRLSAHAKGAFRHAIVTRFPDLEITGADLTALRAARPGEDVVLDVPTRAFVAIDVVVTDRGTKAPVAGAVLEPRDPACFADASYTTGADGVAHVRLVAEESGRGLETEAALRARTPWIGGWAWRWSVPRDDEDWGGPDAGVRTVDGRNVARLRVERGREVRCVLVDGADGRPVAGAESRRIGFDASAPLRTGDDGRFTLLVRDRDDDRDSLYVDFDRWFTERTEIPADGSEARVVAWRRRDVVVVVHGVPAEVRRISARLTVPGDDAWSGTASDDRDDGARDRTLRIEAPARALDVVVTTPDERLRASGKVAADADRVELTLAAVPVFAVTAEVVTPDGAPVAGVLVTLGWTELGARARTDDRGVARFELPEGTYESLAVSVEDCDLGRGERAALTVPAAAPLRIVARVSVPVTVALRGRAPDRGALSSARFTLVLADGTRVLAETGGWSDSEGRVSLTADLPVRAAGTLELVLAGKTFTWPFDPAAPAAMTVTLE